MSWTPRPLPSSLTPLLLPGEQVRWFGQPHAHVYALRGVNSLLYGITWAILGSFWYRGSGGVGADSVFDGWWRLMPLATIPFVLVGLSFFYFPLHLARQARFTWYVITNQRILIARLTSHRATPQLTLLTPNQLAAPEDRLRWDRLHDLILTRRGQKNPELTPDLNAGFLGISEVAPALQALWGHPAYSPICAA